MDKLGHGLLIALALLLPGTAWAAQPIVLDDFETLTGWSVTTSEGVDLELVADAGHTGKGMRLDFDFHGGGGYVIARRPLALHLPDNYQYSFYIRGDAPDNAFEYKLVDPSGKNVWRINRRGFSFPHEWKKVTIKKRHLDFAWGPAGAEPMKNVGSVEFAIAAGNGGKGSVWLDDLGFTEREPMSDYALTPEVRASSWTGEHAPSEVLDTEATAGWRSEPEDNDQWLQLDFHKTRAYGGLVIDWNAQDYATDYAVQASADGRTWRELKAVKGSNGGRDYLYLPDRESRYLRINLERSSRGKGYGIDALEVKPFQFSSSPTRFFEAVARDRRRGLYPKYLTGEQSYWTLVGARGDDKEGLLNEEGMLEVDMGKFSLEPFVHTDGELITWADVERTQSLENDYLPIPSVTWAHDKLRLKVTAFAAGEPGASSLYARYRIENTSAERHAGKLFLALRPFQVNPPWQFLNVRGGPSEIHRLRAEGSTFWVDDDKAVFSLSEAQGFGATTFDQGPIADYLQEGRLPPDKQVSDDFGYASGAMAYDFDLPAGASKDVYVMVPFHDPGPTLAKSLKDEQASALGRAVLDDTLRDWQAELDRVELRLPASAQNISNTLKSTLAYILINKDGPAIQPGSRSYERSWIRDGALTSAAMLQMGFREPVREFIEWFAQYQFDSGKVPCCVDARGADPVPEHDSHGQLIYLVTEYYRYTHDVAFLRKMWPHVVKAVHYIDSLRHQNMTKAYHSPAKAAFYGLLPESISHEGYAADPMHSYWDNFFTMLGLKDAASMAKVLGDTRQASSFTAMRDDFRHDLYASLKRTMSMHGIDYIPGAVELGDFDPPSTTVAVAPAGELADLPQAALQRTFERYYQYFSDRRDGKTESENYTPYELRVLGTFVRLGQKERAHELLDFFLADQRPKAWNQWAEIVWRDRKAPKYIGDMPHTWVGSDFIRGVRSMFVYERPADDALVIAAGVPGEWVTSPEGVTLKRWPTHYGTLNYALRAVDQRTVRLHMTGDVNVPAGKIVVESPLAAPLRGVTVNGEEIDNFTREYAVIDRFPADVELHYSKLNMARRAD